MQQNDCCRGFVRPVLSDSVPSVVQDIPSEMRVSMGYGVVVRFSEYFKLSNGIN
ncbi:hypothetical protein N665_0272s0003 [Sinapis alba]|nr:hypothetical protein N665_0272s0003 [Sinapis alba]